MVWPMSRSGCGGPCWGSMESPRRIILSRPDANVAACRGSCHDGAAFMRTLVICAVLGALATRSAQADDAPSVQSRSVFVLDAATGDEIFGKDADEIRPIASTTK